jgi:hypothetical protein
VAAALAAARARDEGDLACYSSCHGVLFSLSWLCCVLVTSCW